MKISIRRHGVVIRTIESKDKVLKVGSDPECSVHLDDPYLAAHVADIVYRGDDWYIVESALSMGGILRDGQPVTDEPLLPGKTYSIGAFELVTEGYDVSPSTMAGMTAVDVDPSEIATRVGEDIRSTQPGGSVPPPPPLQSEAPEVPKTEMLELGELRKKAGFDQTVEEPTPEPAAKQKFQFEPVAEADPVPPPPLVPPVSKPAPVAAASTGGGLNKKILIPLLVVVLLVVVAVFAVVILKSGGGGDSEVVEETIDPDATGVPLTSPDQLVSEGDQLAVALEIDAAIAKWEEAMNRGAEGAVKDRYVSTLMELAQVHSAAHDPSSARNLYQKVLQYGDPASPEVAEAKERLSGE